MNADLVELNSQLPSLIKGDAHLLIFFCSREKHALFDSVSLYFSCGVLSVPKCEGKKTQHCEYQSWIAGSSQDVQQIATQHTPSQACK